MVGGQVSQEDGFRVPLGLFDQFSPAFSQQFLQPLALLEAAVVEAVLPIEVGDPLSVEPVVGLQRQNVRAVAPGLGPGGVQRLAYSADGDGLLELDADNGRSLQSFFRVERDGRVGKVGLNALVAKAGLDQNLSQSGRPLDAVDELRFGLSGQTK